MTETSGNQEELSRANTVETIPSQAPDLYSIVFLRHNTMST